MHKTINNILSLIVLFLGLYLVLLPVLPEVTFYGQKIFTQSEEKLSAVSLGDLSTVTSDNKRLIIPAIYVDGKVYEGEDPNVLNSGVWHRPGTSTPSEGGNTVFVAHRFQYTSGPNTFYHLDKVKPGEIITVIWEGSPYQYDVQEVFEVTPDQVDIEAPSDKAMITLYTCTPLWTAERRLVVRGTLIQ